MYENHKLCDSLKPREICLVVEQYTKGVYIRKFHEHVSKSRLSKDARINLLRSLVIHFSKIGAETIVQCHVNKRVGKPTADNRLRITTKYPEPGVLRHYCGSNTVAWLDAVIAPDEFRRPD